ncbi:MAG: flavin monoamine oxidase family protein [Solirubrobacteraceae bacterium]
MPPSTDAPLPVVVVGAGLAGLHAAWRLHCAGIEVLVLEARDRVGGRTWSCPLANGSIVERGGEFIAPDHHVLRSLSAELGLELVPHGFSFDRRPTPHLTAPTEADLVALAAWTGRCAAALTEDASAADALPPRDQWSSIQASALRRLETSLTVPLSEVSARRTFTGAIERYDPADRVGRGNQAIALELARRLGRRVHVATAVAAVRDAARRPVVVTDDDRAFDATAVVLALPLPLLLELDIDPGLPADINGAASRTRFGDAVKLHIPLLLPPAPGGMAAVKSCWWCWTSQATAGDTLAAPLLSCFAGSSSGIDALSPEAALALRPDVMTGSEPALVTHWGAERWTGGSYTAPGVGLTGADDAVWLSPLGSIVLAGEHTAGDMAGTMNGAAASGARAAATVLRLLEERRA